MKTSTIKILSLILFLLQIQQIKSKSSKTKKLAPAIFVFGDSIVDPGNNNAILTMVKCNFAPYGQNFPGHVATGRFSNGRVPGDIFASRLGIKDYVPPYLGSNLTDYDLLTGVNFASGGCGFDPLTAQLVQAISMDEQLKLFEEYKEKIKGIAGEKIANEIVSKSFYLVVTGSDDLANTYFTFPVRKNYDLSSYIHFVIQYASKFIQDLYKLGARRITVASMPPLGCIPSQRTNAGGTERECVSLYNQAAIVFNSELQKEIERLNQILHGSRTLFMDIYTPVLDIIQNPSNYGFEVANRGCCGTGLFEVTLMCNEYTAESCKNVSKFVFWDTFHPTERAYDIIINKTVQKHGLNV